MRAWIVKLEDGWHKKVGLVGPTSKAITTENINEAWTFRTMQEAAEFVADNADYIDARRIELVLVEANNVLEVAKHYDKENKPSGVHIHGEAK